MLHYHITHDPLQLRLDMWNTSACGLHVDAVFMTESNCSEVRETPAMAVVVLRKDSYWLNRPWMVSAAATSTPGIGFVARNYQVLLRLCIMW